MDEILFIVVRKISLWLFTVLNILKVLPYIHFLVEYSNKTAFKKEIDDDDDGSNNEKNSKNATLVFISVLFAEICEIFFFLPSANIIIIIYSISHLCSVRLYTHTICVFFSFSFIILYVVTYGTFFPVFIQFSLIFIYYSS